MKKLYALSIACCLTTLPSAHAAQVMNEVWFPDGTITWQEVDTNATILSGINAAMTYFSQRTPLTLLHRPSTGALEIKWEKGLFDGMYAGETKGYRNAGKNKPLIRLSQNSVNTSNDARNVLMHEMGHALGFTHEFQRADRNDNVSMPFSCTLDPFNFDIVGSGQASILTPYDTFSQFATGYNCPKPAPLSPRGALLSAHDINAIYRVYGRSLATNVSAADRFGVSVTTGDYDGDDIQDVVVASLEPDDAENHNVTLNFFKGVATNPEDTDPGTSYMPWFRTTVGRVPTYAPTIALTSGDIRKRGSSTSVVPGIDGIDEVILGMPGYDGRKGIVGILTINVEDRFGTGDHPWGGKFVFNSTFIRPFHVGLSAQDTHEFGASVLLANLSNSDIKDLVIGAPFTMVSGTNGGARAGGAIYLPGSDMTKALRIANAAGVVYSRFGDSLTVVPNLYKVGFLEYDALAIGAPIEDKVDLESAGAVYIYSLAQSSSGSGALPVMVTKLTVTGDKARFGQAIAGFLTNSGATSWFPKHHLVVGSPGRHYKADIGGTVWLYDVATNGSATFITSRHIPTQEANAEFGAALAVSGGGCHTRVNPGSNRCPKGDVWIAIGAPNASVSGSRVGAAYVWNVWDSMSELESAQPARIASGSAAADLGMALTSIREADLTGGFVVGAPDAAVFVGIGSTQPAGVALVHLNSQNTGGSWTSWQRTLSKLTMGDKLPENR